MTHEPEVDVVERLLRLAGPRATASDDRRRRVHNLVRAEWRDAVRATRARRRWLVGSLTLGTAAAAAVLMVFLPHGRPDTPGTSRELPIARLRAAHVGSSRDRLPGHLEAGRAFPIGTRLAVPSGVWATLALEGGGELRIDEGTTVRFVAPRQLELQAGAVYVVSDGPTGAEGLVIHTPAGLVRDIGTRFEVRLDGHATRVRVRDGLVRLERGPDQFVAAAGRELTASSDGSVTIRRASGYGDVWGWVARAAPFDVEGATLGGFLEWVSRESGRSVEFGDPSIERAMRDTRLHGAIDGLTAEEALDVILPACGLGARIVGDRILVDRPEQQP